MNRKVKRKIGKEPIFTCFKPDGLTKAFLRKNGLFNEVEVDEFEAFRLAHLEGLSMVEGAGEMGISPSTFNRILNSAQKKIADSITNGKGIRVFRSDGSSTCN